MKRITSAIIAAAAAITMLLPAASGASAAGTEKEPVNKPHETTDTLSAVASVSKMFATAAVMQLADAGKVDLDKPVTEYLPEFQMADSRYKDITVRMLMNHTSGLMGSHYAGTMFYADRSHESFDNLLQNLSTERLKAMPGAYGAYCNDGFDLLALITEQVSGESYTDYVEKHICKPMGMQQTGTPWNAFQTDEQMRVFNENGVEFPAEYDMTLGGGGILSTAPELSKFGTAFYTGNTVLLSEKAKNEMKQNYAKDEYEDGFGLGWDTVADADFTAAGVQVLSKGGDLAHQHAELYVAPDEKISIGVTCAGGSSNSAKTLAAALMRIALEEQDISVPQSRPEPKETVDAVPEKYLQYAGLYLSGSGMYEISFQDSRFMEVKDLCTERVNVTDYLYTTEDSFVKMEGNAASGKAVQTELPETGRFCEKNGHVYVITESWGGDSNLGYTCSASYAMEKVSPNKISDTAEKTWKARSGKKYFLSNECASSAAYNAECSIGLFLHDGYINGLKIIDETHAQSVITVPSSASRDQTDIEIVTENGKEYLKLTDQGYTYMAEDAMADFTQDLTGVQLTTGAAAWYNIGSEQFRSVTLDIPEHAAVYVYDKYGEPVYSSYMKYYGISTVSLPADGKIVFIGETGSTVGIQQ